MEWQGSKNESFRLRSCRRFPGTGFAKEHFGEIMVLMTLIEYTDPKISRVILTYVSDNDLLAKHNNFADVYRSFVDER